MIINAAMLPLERWCRKPGQAGWRGLTLLSEQSLPQFAPNKRDQHRRTRVDLGHRRHGDCRAHWRNAVDYRGGLLPTRGDHHKIRAYCARPRRADRAASSIPSPIFSGRPRVPPNIGALA
jgi:hypothetical protein